MVNLLAFSLTRRWLTPRALVSFACALLISCTSPTPIQRHPMVPRTGSISTFDEDLDLNRAVLAAHNVERAQKHLSPLNLNHQLTQAAEKHAADMARRGKMTHRGGDGSSPFDRIAAAHYSFQAAAENVAYGFDQVDQVMTGWMRSPGHRRNILGSYAEIGVGRVIAPGDISYWCVTFGNPTTSDFPSMGRP